MKAKIYRLRYIVGRGRMEKLGQVLSISTLEVIDASSEGLFLSLNSTRG